MGINDYHDDIRQEQMWEMQALNSQNATSNLTSAHDNTLNGGCGNGLPTNGMSISSSGSSCSTGSTGSTTNGTNGPLSNGTGLNGVVSAAQVTVSNGVTGLGTGSNASATVGVGSDLTSNGTTQPSSVVSELQHVTNSLTVRNHPPTHSLIRLFMLTCFFLTFIASSTPS
uniref:Uncharacterized protein n=1 Tax=Anopheles culicifacies TaxID=139723 RepID=A0A182MVK6_9DIPT